MEFQFCKWKDCQRQRWWRWRRWFQSAMDGLVQLNCTRKNRGKKKTGLTMKLPGEAIVSSVQGPRYDPQWHKTTEAKQKMNTISFMLLLLQQAKFTSRVWWCSSAPQHLEGRAGRSGVLAHPLPCSTFEASKGYTSLCEMIWTDENCPHGLLFHSRDVGRAYWVKVLAIQPGELSSIPRTHVRVGQEEQLLKVVLQFPWSPHACYGIRVHIHIHHMVASSKEN